MTILLVDDDAASRAMMGLSLRQAGHRVLTAASGPEALRVLEVTACQWLITDAKMSPMDGFELSQQAKHIQPGLHVLMVSALYSERDTTGYPIDKFFPKPVDVEKVLGCIGAPPAAGTA